MQNGLNHKVCSCIFALVARGFLKEELWTGEEIRERRGEKISGCPKQLIDLTVPIDLNCLSPDWRNLIAYLWLAVVTNRVVVIGCLLIDLVMLIDSYHSMMVRFASHITRGFSRAASFSLFSLVSSWWKKTSGTRVLYIRLHMIITYILIYQHNSNVLPVWKLLEGLFNFSDRRFCKQQ